MARIKQTVNLRKIVEKANNMLSNSDDSVKESRLAIQVFITQLLMDSNAYEGFHYINGYPCEDESRIYFYINSKLK